MLPDNATWLYNHIKNKNAVFARETLRGKVHLIALNRSARRTLESKRIQTLAKKMGATIEDNAIS
jgi:hypothetical protein